MGTNERENRYNTLLWDELKKHRGRDASPNDRGRTGSHHIISVNEDENKHEKQNL